MGFSVSGATAIILLGMLIAFGAAFASVSNGLERVSDAQDDRSDRLVAQQNTDVEIVNATYADETLTVAVNNTGSHELSVAETSVLVDGKFQDVGEDDTDIDGDEDTNLWLPSDQLTVTIDELDEGPDRVRVVTETGIAATNTSVEGVNE